MAAGKAAKTPGPYSWRSSALSTGRCLLRRWLKNACNKRVAIPSVRFDLGTLYVVVRITGAMTRIKNLFTSAPRAAAESVCDRLSLKKPPTCLSLEEYVHSVATLILRPDATTADVCCCVQTFFALHSRIPLQQICKSGRFQSREGSFPIVFMHGLLRNPHHQTVMATLTF